MKNETSNRGERLFKFMKALFVVPLVLSLIIAGLSVEVMAGRDKKAPTAPASLQLTGVTDTTVSLSWRPSTDNVGVIGYWVYQGTALIATTKNTAFTAAGLLPSKAYSFSVKAVDAAGNVSGASNRVSVTTLSGAVSEPQPYSATEPAPAPAPVTEPVQQHRQAVIGYYTGWSTYSGRQIADLDGSKLTHINYAFANIGADYKITLGDSYADVEKRFTGDQTGQPFYGNFNQLLKLKQRYPHLKTFISVGGWSWSGRFSDAALTDASRTVFANSAVEFIVKYGFDGVDIDWEYPVVGGAPGGVNRPEDKQNFTLLMQKLREKLDEQGARDGKRYLLSFAGGAGAYYANNVELAKLQSYADFVNIMSYDIHGPWDTRTGLNAPLYKDPASVFAGATSVHDTVQLYIRSGVPAAKVVMGVAFYGYKYDNAANVNGGLYQTYSGSAAVTYSEITANYLNKGYVRYFHKDSLVPYLFNGSSFITYDDPESMRIKGEYVRNQSLGGAMIWALSQDSVSGELLQALHTGIQP
ncbi:glycoside hydrolase family 18 protein [Paenibacillus tarimensis]|uniref:glycoside hydrolase family 18 protein n=1 Tax=Paenibacillus tarimensis TaxID=416012 RepID=UPI001F2384DD|nr:glycosyl hydrolase family 18 protein [Paenibacillus tarimensis]MCF2945087.1 glycosyl hydrolase family 18 protein [Paenibacillus tarimensis]